MAALAWTAAAIILYVVSDALLEAVERHAGRRLPQRSLIFFAVLLTLSLVTFALLRHLFG